MIQETAPYFHIRLRLYNGEDIAMGPGKADLLEAISKSGSISAAGRDIGLSYRRAWLLVDTMNRSFREPLVITARGGEHGGGARLTDLGRSVLERYRVVQSDLQKLADRYCADFNTDMVVSVINADETTEVSQDRS